MTVMENVKFETLMGKTLDCIDVRMDSKQNDEIIFRTKDGQKYRMYHRSDCCECVRVEDICGCLDDLVHNPILQAEVVSSENSEPKPMHGNWLPESWTWTFYKLATINGSVTIRWLGESNGYYSEAVNFEPLTDD